MHIILGMLGTIVTILWLLHRLAEMGIDLGGLNPWLWQRRRRWKTQFEANPIFAIESPLEATALLLLAVAKADGDMSSIEKRELLGVFEGEFGLSKRDAAGLLVASSHLLGKGDEVRDNLAGVLDASLANFSDEQSRSAVELMRRIAQVDGPPTEMQNELMANASEILTRVAAPKGKWD